MNIQVDSYGALEHLTGGHEASDLELKKTAKPGTTLR